MFECLKLEIFLANKVSSGRAVPELQTKERYHHNSCGYNRQIRWRFTIGVRCGMKLSSVSGFLLGRRARNGTSLGNGFGGNAGELAEHVVDRGITYGGGTKACEKEQRNEKREWYMQSSNPIVAGEKMRTQ